MPIQDGHVETQAQGADHGREEELGAGIPSSDALAVRASGLSLGEAEDIAARRLRDLAIRLNHDEPEEADAPGAHRDPAPPFDADRHFRARLAKRIADLSNDQHAAQDDEPAAQGDEAAEASEDATHEPALLPPPYAVTEARLDDFGERFSTLLRSASSPSHLHALPAFALRSELATLHIEPDEPAVADHRDEPLSLTQALTASAGVVPAEDEPRDLFAPAVRLVDLIREQRTLLDRLADLSLGQEAPADDRPLEQPDAIPGATVFLRAEESVESADAGADDAIDSHPVTISAEELIAALKTTVPVRIEEPEPALSELQIRQPDDVGSDALGLRQEAPSSSADHLSERPPMIIERARAELSALESGAAIHPVPPPSGAVGFVAGLSLSMVIGAILYVVLQT